eukprot:2600242-Prymnesium_polylepis.1
MSSTFGSGEPAPPHGALLASHYGAAGSGSTGRPDGSQRSAPYHLGAATGPPDHARMMEMGWCEDWRPLIWTDFCDFDDGAKRRPTVTTSQQFLRLHSCVCGGGGVAAAGRDI